MDIIANPTNDDLSIIKVKAETKCVLEAFLKRSLSQDEGRHLGHVGRAYHDPKKYSHSHEESKEFFLKKSKKSDRKKSKEHKKDERSRSPTFGEQSSLGYQGTWSSLHEEINRVEETKHGFQTSIKKLLKKQSQAKEKAGTPKEKYGSIHGKSRDSIDAILDDHGKAAAKADSLKRPKSPNPLLACTVVSSTLSLSEEEQRPYESETHEKHGTPKKSSRPFSFKRLLKKKPHKENAVAADSKPARPDFLPVKSCYDEHRSPDRETKLGRLEDSEIYSLAAKKLETLIKHKKVKSPLEPDALCGLVIRGDNNNVTTDDRPADQDEVIQKLVALLQEQAVVINEKINKDPFLRNTLSRMSYGSFFRLAEVFTSEAEVEKNEEGSSVSPELTKIALTMELTRKVAGINSHAVHTLMGYSLQYMDMFVPWLQKQGGWEKIVSNGDISDLQID
ncbi:bcl-2-like protein 12 [Rhinoderma darwinii]|uniref:bcl-2-like protein 12 n=1 Tax=Rhinoderma darwinii TaxID=43563 RepID=UPI003F677C62